VRQDLLGFLEIFYFEFLRVKLCFFLFQILLDFFFDVFEDYDLFSLCLLGLHVRLCCLLLRFGLPLKLTLLFFKSVTLPLKCLHIGF